MRNLHFARVNTKIYNIFLSIILPLVAMALLYPYVSLLLKLKADWLFTLEFLKLVVVVMCYAVPVTYFLSKAYKIAASGDDQSRVNTILGFMACCLLILPLAFIGLAMFAKLSFYIPIAFTAGIVYVYFRSYKVNGAIA